MFGVVPKTMWQKVYPSDERNLCTWAMRCLLVRTDDGHNVLIDTGIGTKQDDKFRSHFEPHGSETLLTSLAAEGLTPNDITDVVLTHFHFDHVGGAVERVANGTDAGALVPTFPRATYWSNERHYDWAFTPNPREKASFLKENFVPLKEQGVLKFVDTDPDVELFKGFRLRFAYGHTEAMMLPLVTLPNGRQLLFAADLLPSPHHIGLPYVMSYDIRPLETMKEKESTLREAAEKGFFMFFEHDRNTECATLRFNERGAVVLDRTYTLAEALLSEK